MNADRAVPGWFWLLPLVAAAAWWPIDSYWQSDDFLALHYARDLRAALADWVGPQYGATDIWLFYRPLITLSFWLDLQLGGTPFVSHLSNALAHAVSCLLVGLLWRRWLPTGAAAGAALWWALLPSHAGSLQWAVGRVDSHTTVWILLALWAWCRAAEGRPGRGLALLATALALASKELAFTVPPLATVLATTVGPDTSPRDRLRRALCTTWPAWLLFALYLGFRLLVLGRLGGYLSASYAPAAMLRGLVQNTGNLLVPLRWSGAGTLAAATGVTTPVWCGVAAIGPLLAAALWTRRPRAALLVLATFLVACVPLAPFLADAGNVHSLRYFYLPTIALAGFVAGGGRLALGLALAGVLWPLVAVRLGHHAADRESAAMHRALLREANEGAPAPLFVAGLPHSTPDGAVVQLHFGVDRLLEPPFGRGGSPLYAYRPLAEIAGVVRLSPPGEAPFALPSGSTWWFADPTALARVPERASTLPDLPLAGDQAGIVDVSTTRLFEVTRRAQELFAAKAPSFGLTTPGVKPAGFRVTIFTANGYLACLCHDYGLAGPQAGSIDLLRFLAQDPVGGVPPAVTATLGTAWAGEGLVIPTTLDLVTDFPVLVEAGGLVAGEFVPTHRARRLLTFRFDRGYPAWVRAVQGRG